MEVVHTPASHLRRSNLTFETAAEHAILRVPVAGPFQRAGDVRPVLAGQRYESAAHVVVCEAATAASAIPIRTLSVDVITRDPKLAHRSPQPERTSNLTVELTDSGDSWTHAFELLKAGNDEERRRRLLHTPNPRYTRVATERPQQSEFA